MIPPARRGTVHDAGLMHVADWYATFCELAATDPTDKKAAAHPGIPAIDSMSHWTAIVTGQQTGRSTIVLSTHLSPDVLGPLGTLGEDEEGQEFLEMAAQAAMGASAVDANAAGSAAEAKGADAAIIIWPHKLVLGTQRGMGVWTGKVHPNATTRLKDNDPGCPAGCVFGGSSGPCSCPRASLVMLPSVALIVVIKL
eukprot:SAG11_NODE_2844_length_2914_cov_1.684192_5_plen_197_part_00